MKDINRDMVKRVCAKNIVPNRVLHLSSAHPWNDNRIHWREAASLASAGYDVGLHAVDGDEASDATGGSSILVSKTAPLSRPRRMTLGTLRAYRVALASRAELIHIHDPELIWTIPLLRVTGRKVVYDAHEDLPAQVMDKSYLSARQRRIFRWAAKGLVRLANMSSNHVVAATETIAARFDRDKTVVVRNFPQSLGQEADYVDIESRDFNAAYVGGISSNRGGGTMVDAFASTKIPNGWRLLMAGAVSSEYVQSLQQKQGWDRTTYLGKISPLESRSLIRRSRIGIVVLKNTVAYRDSLPTKMFEYMAEGAAVIASDFPLWREIIEKYDCGVLVDEDSPDAIAEAIARYAEDEELLRRHSSNGVRAAKEIFNWGNEAKKLVAMYRRVLRKQIDL